MKVSELRQKSKEEIQSLLWERRVRADDLRFLLQQKKVKNVKERAAIKKDIARIRTILHEHA